MNLYSAPTNVLCTRELGSPGSTKPGSTKEANQKSKIPQSAAHSTRWDTRLTAPEPSTMLRLVQLLVKYSTTSTDD
jgi:hypothetical protein